MARKTRSADRPLTPRADRFRTILQGRYDGDQTRMADETGISQPQISLINAGKRSPGAETFARLETIPGINREWLHSGVGEPFITEPRSVPAGGPSLQVYRDPPDHAGGDAGQRSGLHLQVGDLFGPRMYLLEVQADDPVARVPELKVAPGDLLVMETDRAAWERNPRSLVGKLAVIRLRGPDGADHTLARIEASPDTGRLAANIFGTGTVPLTPSGGEAGAGTDAGQPGCTGPKASDWSPLAEAREHAPEGAQATSPEGYATLPARPFVWAAPSTDDILAICETLIRHCR